MKILIKDIHIGSRVREDIGDITSLKNSLKKIGQQQPIVVTSDENDPPQYTLRCGLRRLKAAKALRWEEIEAYVVDSTPGIHQLIAERDENTERKELTPSEIAKFAQILIPLEATAAKERQRQGGKNGGKAAGKLTEVTTGGANDKVAKALGVSRNTLNKAQEVVAAGQEDPEKYGHLTEKMDRTGKVSGVHAELRQLKQVETSPVTPAQQVVITPVTPDVNIEIIGFAETTFVHLGELNAKRGGQQLSDDARQKLTGLVTKINQMLAEVTL